MIAQVGVDHTTMRSRQRDEFKRNICLRTTSNYWCNK